MTATATTTWVFWDSSRRFARGGVSVNEAKIEPKERDDDDDECAQIKLPPTRAEEQREGGEEPAHRFVLVRSFNFRLQTSEIHTHEHTLYGIINIIIQSKVKLEKFRTSPHLIHTQIGQPPRNSCVFIFGGFVCFSAPLDYGRTGLLPQH